MRPPRVSDLGFGQTKTGGGFCNSSLCLSGREIGMILAAKTGMGLTCAVVAALLLLVLACLQQENVLDLRSLFASPTAHVWCWDTESVSEQDCYHAEPLELRPYPLTKEVLDRSVSYSASDLRLHGAFQRARKRGVLRVVVLGGSVTFGHGCRSPMRLEAKDCAWPHRLEQWFQERIHDFKVEVSHAKTRTDCPRKGQVQQYTFE